MNSMRARAPTEGDNGCQQSRLLWLQVGWSAESWLSVVVGSGCLGNILLLFFGNGTRHNDDGLMFFVAIIIWYLLC